MESTISPAPVVTPPDSAATVASEAGVAAPLGLRAWLQARVEGPVCIAVAIAWFVLLEIATALEPATTRAEPVIGVFLQLSMWLLLATMITGLVMQRRFGLVASLGGAVLATAASIACPISGHHAFGVWWYGQFACMLALLAVSVVALKREPRDVEAPRA